MRIQGFTAKGLWIALAALGLAGSARAQNDTFWLVPPETRFGAPSRGGEAGLPNDGPKIVIEAPPPNEKVVTPPINITVDFVPRDQGAQAQPSSFKVKVKFLGGWMDVTGEVLKHTTVSAEGVKVNGAMLPKGDHTVRIEIADQKGRVTVTQLAFTVT